jgi:hypothetical protein
MVNLIKKSMRLELVRTGAFLRRQRAVKIELQHSIPGKSRRIFPLNSFSCSFFSIKTYWRTEVCCAVYAMYLKICILHAKNAAN